MQKNMGIFTRIVILLTLLAGVGLPRQGAFAAGTVGDGTPTSCTQAALQTALSGGGAVTFNCGAAKVTILISPAVTISQNTSIDGGGLITLSGNNTSQIFIVNSGASLGLTGITLTKGSAPQGGAINSRGTLTITNSTFTSNQATSATGQGGAIYSTGTLNLTNTTFIGNAASAAGGAVFSSGPLTITGGLFNLNQVGNGLGGGVYSSGALAISGTSFTSNFASHTSAASGGGGLFSSGSAAGVSGSTFFANTGTPRGGSLYVGGGSLTVTASTLDSNFSLGADGGGGIYNQGTLVLSQDLIVSNNASNLGTGSGIQNDPSGILTVTNTTLAYNSAGLGGSAIYNMGGTVTVTNSTISINGGTALNNASGSFSLVNSIVAGNTTNCAGAITSLGHNLDSANTCAFTGTGDLPNTDPKLGPLAANGGPTDTFALLYGSPAINSGDNASCPPTDQRGFHRPQFSTCDLGAYEFVLWQFLPAILK